MENRIAVLKARGELTVKGESNSQWFAVGFVGQEGRKRWLLKKSPGDSSAL